MKTDKQTKEIVKAVEEFVESNKNENNYSLQHLISLIFIVEIDLLLDIRNLLINIKDKND